MQLHTISVALPREIPYGERTVATAIFKRPVPGPVRVHAEHLEGDGQADRVHHGGPDKAVYAYALEHYAWWQRELGGAELPHGQFGENLTIAGLDEATLCVGDQLVIGTARFVVTQPRIPCFKLGLRFGDPTMPQRFAAASRSGMYLRVLEQGVVAAGDAVQRVASGRGGVAIRPLFDAWLRPNDPQAQAVLQRALDVPELAADWRESLAKRLARRHLGGSSPTQGDAS